MDSGSSSVFMTNNTLNGAKKRRESTKPESRQMAKMFFSLLLLLFLLLLLLNRSLKNYGFLRNAIFSSHICMHTNHLATKCNYYVRLLIRNTVDVQGVFEKSLAWSMILQPILHRKPVRETCCSVIDGKPQLKHACAAKRK